MTVIQLGRTPITQSCVDGTLGLHDPRVGIRIPHHTEKDILPIICQDDDRPDTERSCCRKEGQATPIQRGPGPAGGREA